MSSIGYELIKTNPDNSAVTIAPGGAVIFDSTILNPTPDNNISYDPLTGTFTFTDPGDYYVYWFINSQTSSDLEVKFEIQISDTTPAVTYSYPGSSIFKTGQFTGSAIITPVAGGTMQLVNTSLGTTTLAIGTGMVTAEIAIVHIPSLSGVQAYVLNPGSQVTVPANSPIPFNNPLTDPTDGNVTISTNNSSGLITITSPGTYLVDWWLALSDATGANQLTLNLSPVGGSPLAYFNAAVSTDTHMSGFAIITVTPAQAAGPYVIALYNDTLDPTFTTSLPIELSKLIRSASIRVVGTGL